MPPKSEQTVSATQRTRSSSKPALQDVTSQMASMAMSAKDDFLLQGE